MILNIRHTSETTGKNAHIALTLTYGKVAVCTPVCSGACQLLLDASFHSANEKHKLAASAKKGRNREDSQNKWFW